MNTLFDEPESPVLQKEKQLKITLNKGKILSKNQQLFNRLIKKIETLNKSIARENAKLDKLLLEFSKHNINQVEKQIAEIHIAIAKLIDKSAKLSNYSNKQKNTFGEVIVWLCDNAFRIIIPDEETKALYDSYAEIGFDEESKVQELSVKEMLSGEFRQHLGIDIDFSDIDDSPEGMAKFKERLKEASENMAGNRTNSKRKKTKKQLEKEAILEQEESIKLKSIRSIYISLAKVLHPDTVVDEFEKLKKEELMKRVTTAYNEKDLSTLLKLELEWVVAESQNIDALTEEKLKIYNSALKEQSIELEMEYRMLHQHPRYNSISEFAMYPEHYALLQMKDLAEATKRRATVNENILAEIQRDFSKQIILKYTGRFMKEIKDERNDFPDFYFNSY